MTTTTLSPTPAAVGFRPTRPPHPSAVAHEKRPDELLDLAGVVPGEGPPIVLLAAPLVLFGLALAGPFLLLLTLAALLVACAALLALAGAVVAGPYLLTRRLARRRRPRAHRSAARLPRLRRPPERGSEVAEGV